MGFGIDSAGAHALFLRLGSSTSRVETVMEDFAMHEKDFILSLMVPGGWLAGILGLVAGIIGFVVYTVASPVLFFIALFYPGGPEDLVNALIGEEAGGQE